MAELCSASAYSTQVQQPLRAGAHVGGPRGTVTSWLIREDARVTAPPPVADTEEVTGSNPVRPTRSKRGIEYLEQTLGAIPGAK